MYLGIAVDPGGFALKVQLTSSLKAAGYEVADVKAALITDAFSAHQGVEYDDMNVMCLGGLVTGYALSWDFIQTFLSAHFKGDERFRRGLAKVATLEREKKP